MQNFTIFSPYTDIHMNLALEQQLAQALPPGSRILLLWVDGPAVVFGRFQDPWAECRVDLLEPSAVLAARRFSGGGTVYHDLGNLNYSVIAPPGLLDIPGNLHTTAGVLGRQGLDVRIGPRRDLFMGSDKISGSAFQMCHSYGIHHGTLLVHTDLDRLRTLLTGGERGVDSRSVPSVPSPVKNIGEASGQGDTRFWAEQLQEGFGTAWGGFSGEPLPAPDPLGLIEEYQRISSNNWIFGHPYRRTVQE